MHGRSRQTDGDFGGCVKMTVIFLSVSGPEFMEFWDDVGDPSQFLTPFSVVYIMFLAGDIGLQSCH